jgi:hypothetical protein
MLNLLPHEMIHVRTIKKRALKHPFMIKRTRMAQAYYEMLFHEKYPQVPKLPQFHTNAFANKAALEYYNRMGESTLLQIKYANPQKKQK